MTYSLKFGLVGLVVFIFVVLLIGMLMNGPLRMEGFQEGVVGNDKCKDSKCEYPESCNAASGKCEHPANK